MNIIYVQVIIFTLLKNIFMQYFLFIIAHVNNFEQYVKCDNKTIIFIWELIFVIIKKRSIKWKILILSSLHDSIII